MDEIIRAAVRERAGGVCEYCHFPESFHPKRFEIEHVIASQHLGSERASNLALACTHCNRSKGTNLTGIDRQTSATRTVRLFNPRKHRWNAHFRWDGTRLIGITPIGRVTLQVLNMNESRRLALRQELIEEGYQFK